jgi:5'-nucleotidase
MPRAIGVLLTVVLVGCAAVAAEPTHVLIVNDDGWDADGIAALVRVVAADPSYRVSVIAPATQQSGKGHSVHTRGTIEVRAEPPIHGCPTWSVAATPATTVRLALSTLLADDPPQMVLSGINRGENDGRLAWYSGTVGGAREAVMNDVSAVAFSLEMDWDDPELVPDFATAATWAKPVVDAVREHGLPDGVLLNVNVPLTPDDARGYRIARMSLVSSTVWFELVADAPSAADERVTVYRPRWSPAAEAGRHTDTALLDAGWVVIAPLQLDQTAYEAFPALPWVSGLASPERAAP